MIPALRLISRPATAMREILISSGDACRAKIKTEARQKAPTDIHAYG